MNVHPDLTLDGAVMGASGIEQGSDRPRAGNGSTRQNLGPANGSGAGHRR